jgi:mannonate dehydratase
MEASESEQETLNVSSAKFSPDRREFVKLAVGGALGAAAFLPSEATASAAVHKNAPGMKLCAQSSPKPTDEDLLFLKQIGAEYVSVGSTPDLRTAEGFIQIRKRYADAGITVWNIGNMSVHNMPEVTLNLPGRDQKIEEYKQYIRNLGRAGIHYTTYAHMGNGIWSSGRAVVRGASAREFDMASSSKVGVWGDQKFHEPLSHGRGFSRKRTMFASGFTRMIRRCPNWPEFRAASSPISKVTSGPWRLPTAPTLASACAAAAGPKADES